MAARKSAPKKPASGGSPTRRPGGAHNALKAPAPGDQRAIADLELQRELLLKKLKAPKTSPRDLATISAELRKVGHSLAMVNASGQKDGIAEEDLAQRAAAVRDRLRKTIDERERLKVAVAEVTPTPTAEEAATGT